MKPHIIHSHTRADLIKDGALVEVPWVVSNPAGLVLPVAFSRAVWLAVMDGLGVERWPETPDMLMETLLVERATRTLRAAARAVQERRDAGDRGERALFDIPLYSLHLHLYIGPGDKGEPVLTVFMPDED